MREHDERAARAHREALAAAETKAADAERLAALYEQRAADLEDKLRAAGAGGAGAGAPATPPPGHGGRVAGDDPRLAATAADLLGQGPGGLAAGLQEQGKTYTEVVALYMDMVRRAHCILGSSRWRTPPLGPQSRLL